MSEENDAPPTEPAREADRYYGFLLFFMALASVAAPLFAEAGLGWTLFLSGLIGGIWLVLDRTPRGYSAAVVWSVVAFALGVHLTFHVLLGLYPLQLIVGLGFLVMGIAIGVFGMTRYSHSPGARLALGLSGLVSGLFGVAVLLVGPNVPIWSGGTTLGLMFAAFGAALEIGAAQKRARLRAS